jgi:hypothetical protein
MDEMRSAMRKSAKISGNLLDPWYQGEVGGSSP